MLTIVEDFKRGMDELANPEKAKILQKFFKTAKGEYGEGDVFLGITVPQQRTVAKDFYRAFTLSDIQEILHTQIHEYRFTALAILVLQSQKSKDPNLQQQVVDFYLANTQWINNWDLVDVTCPHILGKYVYETGKTEILDKLAQSENLWEKRMSIVAVHYFIRKKTIEIVPKMVLKNLQHPHDLIHKASGWMLREMGKVNKEALLNFLDEFALKMPRTTLRYAIERLDETTRQYYLKLK